MLAQRDAQDKGETQPGTPGAARPLGNSGALHPRLALIRSHQLYIDDDTAAEPERRRLLLKALEQAEALAS